MVVAGQTNHSVATLITNSNAGGAVAPDALIKWSATGGVLRYATLSATSDAVVVQQPGYYQVMVKFNSAAGQPASPQESTMDFVLTVAGSEYGSAVYAGEALVANVLLAANQAVGVKNKALVPIAPDTSAGISWFTISPI